MKPHKQPLRFYGSKWRLMEWITSYHPPHYHYVSVFGGGASDIFNKKPSPLETYNDLDGSVVNFFKVLREQPDELIRLIQFTPFARAELDTANDTWVSDNYDGVTGLELARRFYVRCQQGRDSGTSAWRCSWRHEVKNGRNKKIVTDWSETDHLMAAACRLKKCQIENRPALDIITNYDTPGTLFYADLPYLHSERASNWLKAYKHEMTAADHIKLAFALSRIEGMAIISGYPSKLYEVLYEKRYGWRRELSTARNNNNGTKTEAIWLNPAAQAAGRQLVLPIN